MSELDIGGNALVTGGARGLGRSYALRLAENGFNVAIGDIDLSAYEAYERESEQLGAGSVEVFSAAVPGHTAAQGRELAERVLARWEPDVVLMLDTVTVPRPVASLSILIAPVVVSAEIDAAAQEHDIVLIGVVRRGRARTRPVRDVAPR